MGFLSRVANSKTNKLVFTVLVILLADLAVILGMLCIFAGHEATFMEDYHILTINTSRIQIPIEKIFDAATGLNFDDVFKFLDKNADLNTTQLLNSIGDVEDIISDMSSSQPNRKRQTFQTASLPVNIRDASTTLSKDTDSAEPTSTHDAGLDYSKSAATLSTAIDSQMSSLAPQASDIVASVASANPSLASEISAGATGLPTSLPELVLQLGDDLANGTSFLLSFKNAIQNSISGSIAALLGISDFYSLHILDYCDGWYTPDPVPSTDLLASDIHKNTTECSSLDKLFNFNLTTVLSDTGLANLTFGTFNLGNATLEYLENNASWYDDVQTGLHYVRIVMEASFILYCIGVGLLFIASVLAFIYLLAIVSNYTPETHHRGLFWLGFAAYATTALGTLALILGSALLTAAAIVGSNAITKYGEQVSIEAHRGGKFLALTWAASGCALLAVIMWWHWILEVLIWLGRMFCRICCFCLPSQKRRRQERKAARAEAWNGEKNERTTSA